MIQTIKGAVADPSTATNATNIDLISTVIPQTVSGTLTAKRTNELQDGGTFTLPLANSVDANETITILLPDSAGAVFPVVNRGGSDTITDSVGTDTSLTFAGPGLVIAISDGTSDWRI